MNVSRIQLRSFVLVAFLLLCQNIHQYSCKAGTKFITQKKQTALRTTIHPQILSDATSTFDVNNIKMTMRNSGQLIDFLGTGGPGFEWPKNSLHHLIYTGGLWIAGKVNGSLRIAAVQYDTAGFQPQRCGRPSRRACA